MSVHGGGARGRVCAGHRTAASCGAEPGPAYRQPRYGARNDLYTQGLARGDPFSRKVTRFGITKFLRSAGSGFAAGPGLGASLRPRAAPSTWAIRLRR